MRPMELPLPACICFDLDGTLVDSVADLTVACNLMLQELGEAPLDESTARAYIGDGARMLVLRALGSEAKEIDHAVQRFRSHYADHLLDHTRPYPGVVETLTALGRQGFPMGVVTNKPHDFAVRILEGLGLMRHFHSVAGARPGVPVKPAPDLLVMVLEELGQPASSSWMVGDSPNDVNVAHAAGCVPIALSYGIGKREDLEAAGASVILDHFSGILDLLGRVS